MRKRNLHEVNKHFELIFNAAIDAITINLTSRIVSGARARQKLMRKRNLHEVNEHFELIFNAAIAPLTIRD